MLQCLGLNCTSHPIYMYTVSAALIKRFVDSGGIEPSGPLLELITAVLIGSYLFQNPLAHMAHAHTRDVVVCNSEHEGIHFKSIL